MHEFILFDENFREIGKMALDLDAEYGTSNDSKNDFQIVTAELNQFKPYGGYIEGTEVGGRFEYAQNTTTVEKQTIKGWTWRGLLSQDIIRPPAREDYYTVSGDANAIIAQVTQNTLGGFFKTRQVQSGLNITSYQFQRYINTLDGLERMLEKYGYRLKITAEKENGQIAVYLEAVQAQTVEGIYNEDSRVPMRFTSDAMGINHLILGGAGQLQDRMIVDLYMDENGEISQTQSIFGFEERTSFFDYSSAESEEELIQYGTERFKELASSRKLEILSPEDLDLEIGDKVRGLFQDGTIITSPVVRKVVKIQNGVIKTEIKIKGED